MAKKIILSHAAPAPIGPYSQAVQVGDTLYVSGQIALSVFENSGTIEEETDQVMKNIGCILSEAGFSFDEVVKCSIFVKDMNHFTAINGVYANYFTANPPARETVEVARLPKDVRVEISCIAHK